ncbi:MAG: glycoside hydrolase family 92 protein, partial [Bacteroidales bacterium]|nr:glycoside hydrolase family 92 protein [Bacteroidales bacterium]
MTARLFFFMALVVPAMLFAESREEGVSMPFGSVSVIPDHGGSQHGTVGAFLHRFYHSSSAAQYGEISIVPGAGSLIVTEGSEFYSPGYYKIRSDSPGMEIRVTAAEEGAAHRYAYFTSSGSPQKEGSIMLDLLGNAGEQSARDVVAEVRVTDPVTVTGYVISRGERETGHTYFAIRFSRPVKRYFSKNNPAFPENYPIISGNAFPLVFVFDLVKGEQQYVDDGVLEIRVAFSSVDAAGALNNLETGMEGKNFETLQWEASQKWEEELAVISVDDPYGNEELENRRSLFYKALGRTMETPASLQDRDEKFRGNDNNIHASEFYDHYTAVYPVERERYPLMNFIKPERSRQFVASMLAYYDRNVLEMLPGEALCTGAVSFYTGAASLCTGAVSLLADAHAGGLLPASLTPSLLEAMNSTLRSPYDPVASRTQESGFVPAETHPRSIDLTNDYGYMSWCVFMMAGAAGDVNTVNEIRPFVTAYQWLLDPETGYARQRNNDLSWHNDPDSPENRDRLLFIPHNMNDIVERSGGRKAYEKRLDSTALFDELPYLYTWTASPWKGQKLLRAMMDSYGETVDSPSWFVFSAMGLYPLCPGTDQYVLGAPYFKKMTVHLENKKILTIEAPLLNPANIYVREVRWNGKLWDKAYITHQELAQGGKLEFHMSSRPARGRTFRREK